MMRRFAAAAAALAVGGTTVVACGDAVDASVRIVRRAVTPQRDGAHLAMLSALRQLNEPSLRPLFHQLLERPDWMMQVHAVLGLAELETPPRLTPLLVVHAVPQAQEVIIANAIDLELLDLEQMKEMFAWAELSPMARLMLSAELIGRGETADRHALRRLLAHEDERVRALSACLLAQLGEDGAARTATELLASDGQRARRGRVIWMLDAIRQYKLAAMTDWVDRVLDESASDERVAEDAVFTLLNLAPDRGLARWRERVGPDTPFPRRAHFAMMLLSCAESLPAGAFDFIPGDEAFIRRVADVGRARAAGDDPAGPMIALYDLANLRATEWVVREAEEIEPAQAARVYGHMLDQLESDQAGRAEQAAIAVRAVARMYKIDADDMLRRLRAAENGSMAEQVLLLGLFDAELTDAGPLLDLLPANGFRRTDSLALLLRARHAETLTSDQMSRLGMIASGGGRVSEPLQLQAAWLYLKHSGAIDRALNRVFAP